MSSVAHASRERFAPRKRARDKILTAAEELARVAGPGNLSLDAVAARAGVSKGGLLYHFPTKAKLLEALVEQFLEDFDRVLSEREAECAGAPDSLARAYLDILVNERLCRRPPPSGLLAALGEDPDFLAPVRRFDRRLLDRMKANASDPVMTLIVYLALNGIKSMQLLNVETIDAEEFQSVISRLREMVGVGPSAAPPGDPA